MDQWSRRHAPSATKQLAGKPWRVAAAVWIKSGFNCFASSPRLRTHPCGVVRAQQYAERSNVQVAVLFHHIRPLNKPIRAARMSSVSPYLLYVNSKPTKVSDELWTKWYTEEHLPDLVSSKTSTRATFYKELPPILGGDPNPRNFLALYQTDFEESLKTENYTNLRTTSELFAQEGSTKNIGDNGDFDARNYELIQVYDPNGVGNGMRTPQQRCTNH